VTLSSHPARAPRRPRRRGAAGGLAGVTPGDERVRELYAVLQVMLRIELNLLMAGRERLQLAVKASTGTVSLKDWLAHLRRLRRHLKAVGDVDVPVMLAGARASGPPPAPPPTATLACPAADPVSTCARGNFDKTDRVRPASLTGTARAMPAVPRGPAASGTPPAGRGAGTQACAASNHAAHARSDSDKTNPPRRVGAQKKSVTDTRNNMPVLVDDSARHLEHEMKHRPDRAGRAGANSDTTTPTTRSSTASTNSKTSTPASPAQEERAALAIRALLIRASSA
jgi:hypothetical protein